MTEFLKRYADSGKYSQNGECGILRECVRRMGITSGVACEVGGADGHYCSNIAALIEAGWRGTFVETQFRLWEKCRDNYAGNPKVTCICSHVDQYNINAFVKDDCDVLSIDVDGDDRRIFAGMTAKPKIVIVEIDSSILPGSDELNSDGACGYSPMLALGISKGFFLLCHSGNLLFCDNKYRDLFPEIIGDGVSNSDLYFNRSWVKAG